ncbi:MAG: M23 family metallopeptidase [Parasphingorhabdus sp.]|uniref:M23 family metallopeptidase n=1 Tax=Parasphingorhabdus sp. TaxID=2709688 RepID=UPI003297CF5F
MRKMIILFLVMSVSACIPPGRDNGWPQNEAAQEAAPTLATDISVFGQSPADAPPPTWTAQTVTPNAMTIEDGIYTVQAGDTLRGIANKTGASSQIIAAENGLAAPYIIRPGQRLNITGGRYHWVNGGETGIAIARAYGVPWREVVALNGLEEPFVLRVGQKLLLPAEAPVDPQALSIEQRAASFDLDIDDIMTGSQPALAEKVAAEEPSDWRKAIGPVKTPPAKTPAVIAVPAAFTSQFNWPIDGKLISSFGSKGGGKVNDGLNIAVAKGTPIRAAADGVVAYSGDEIDVFGGLILLNHGDGWVTAYGHADKLHVTRGQKIKAGDIIGLAGDSGYVQEPQLHFEIRKNRKPVNPVSHLPTRT